MEHIKGILRERLERYAIEKSSETGYDTVEVEADYEFLGTVYFGWGEIMVYIEQVPTKLDEEREFITSTTFLSSEFFYCDDNNKKIML